MAKPPEHPHQRGPALENSGRWVLGLQPVREAIAVHGRAIGRVLVSDPPSDRLLALERFARDQGVAQVQRVSAGELDRLSRGVSHQGVAAAAPALTLHGLDVCLAEQALLGVALDSIQDPQNFGAVIRSAVALASATIIWPEHHAAPLSSATFRASAGAIEHARLVRVPSLRGALSELTQAGRQVIGLDAHADSDLSDFDLTQPTVLVIGSEHSGLGRGTRRACSHLARLVEPLHVDSLNASVAAALALYTAVIQRRNSRS